MDTLEKTEQIPEVLEPDPLWDVKHTGRKMRKADRDLFFQGRDSLRDRCGRVTDGHDDNYVGLTGRWECTRGPHPEHWRHIATTGYRGDVEVKAAWGGVNPANFTTVETGEETVDFELEIGKVYKFRNRTTPLLLVGHRDGGVEVLDLEHERYRVLRREQLALRPATADPLTRGQLRWVAKFMADRREKVREIAIQQRNEGRFANREQLDKVLKELRLEPTVRVLSGDYTISGRISGTGVKTNGEAGQLLEAWFKSLPPLPAGLTFTGNAQVATAMRLREG